MKKQSNTNPVSKAEERRVRRASAERALNPAPRPTAKRGLGRPPKAAQQEAKVAVKSVRVKSKNTRPQTVTVTKRPLGKPATVQPTTKQLELELRRATKALELANETITELEQKNRHLANSNRALTDKYTAKAAQVNRYHLYYGNINRGLIGRRVSHRAVKAAGLEPGWRIE